MNDDNNDANPASNLDSLKGQTLTDAISIRSFAVSGIFLLLLFHTLEIAAPLLKPIALAYLLSLLLSPTVRKMKLIGIPEGMGAALVLLVFMAVSAATIYGLSTPAQQWIERTPQIVEEMKRKLQPVVAPLKVARDVVEEASDLGAGDQSANPTEVQVTVAQKGMLTNLLTGTPRALANVGIVLVLLYFLLAGGDSFLNKLVAAMPNLKDKKRVVSIVRDIQSDIAHYLITFGLINACLGFCVAICLKYMGMPNPFLWGALVGTFNFVPYVGLAISVVIITPVALLSFDSLGYAVLIPSVVIVLSVLEGQFLTPHIVGKRLSLSPVVVFIAIISWGWLWGILGALMAIPIIVAVNVVCRRIEYLNPIADFIASRPTND